MKRAMGAAAVVLFGVVAAAQQPQPGPAAPRQASAAGGLNNVEIHVLHVQGDVWMLVGGFVNAAVSVGDDGVLVVDTMPEPLAGKLVAAIRQIAGDDKPIRYIVNTHVHPDHTGGNEKVAAAGESIVAGNFAGQVGEAAANVAGVIAHENVLNRMSLGTAPDTQKRPFKAWPTDTFFDDQKDLYFNGEGIELIHVPSAHTDGDVMVYFRKSDVIAAGDLYINTTYPVIDLARGGNFNGILAAVNRIIDITIPRDKQEGGTYVIPGHGHLADEADVVEYRDMLTIIRDRFADAIKKGMTLDQVRAAKLTRDYDGRYGATSGAWTTDQFVEAVYKSLGQPSTTRTGAR